MWNHPDKCLSEIPRESREGIIKLLRRCQKEQNGQFQTNSHSIKSENQTFAKTTNNQTCATVSCPPVAQSCGRSLSETLKRDIIVKQLVPLATGQIPNALWRNCIYQWFLCYFIVFHFKCSIQFHISYLCKCHTRNV